MEVGWEYQLLLLLSSGGLWAQWLPSEVSWGGQSWRHPAKPASALLPAPALLSRKPRLYLTGLLDAPAGCGATLYFHCQAPP